MSGSCCAARRLPCTDKMIMIRHVGHTDMNAHSSRSHTIFRLVIESVGE